MPELMLALDLLGLGCISFHRFRELHNLTSTGESCNHHLPNNFPRCP